MKDYEKRFIAEYFELSDRRTKLNKMLNDYYDGKLDFEPKTPTSILVQQHHIMCEYLKILEQRAVYEEIDLIGFRKLLNADLKE